MALWCRLFTRVLILVFGIFRLVNFSMECSCMAPLTPVVMVMRGLVFHPLFSIALISDSYLARGCTPLSSRIPRARQQNLLHLSCITKMGRHFIDFFP
jgi:hypothetical protein